MNPWHDPNCYDGTEWGDAFKVIAPRKRGWDWRRVLAVAAALVAIFIAWIHLH